ncbi:hypothetical protein psyc5s11_47480 [Clostridium gelidum]|uniref:ABC-2 type transporter transmembrane domain-containing protein n=1 Tax=Clostridium gelidum TaxID=704125 RepID=A0ABN6J2W1_9CLOT|nr:ABC transporter permease [Clostridium gelidum]BCZ48681.1 hypothetical protein psyc5s11_47480 [Clostridium gelidum]
MSIYLIVKNEIKRSMKNKKKLIITLIVPAIAVVLAICINSIMKPSLSLGIIDKDNSEIGANFEEKVGTIDGIKISQAKEDTINTDLIMAKYVATIEFNKNNQIKLHCLDNELKDTIQEIVDNFIITKEVIGLEGMLIKMEKESMTVAQRSVGFILLTLIVTCVFTSCNLIKDKEEGTLKRYVLTPNAPSAYILGNFIFNFLMTLLQIIISTLIIGILKLDIHINLWQFLLIEIIIAFIASSIATLMVSLVDTELKASLIASSFGLIISLLGGSFLPLEKMPNGIKLLSDFSITKWIIVFTKSLESKLYILQDIIPIIIIVLMSITFISTSLVLGKRKFV